MFGTTRTKVCSASAWWLDQPARSAPVRLNATKGFVRALADDGVSLVVASRQSSRLALVFADGAHCFATTVDLPSPMGVAYRDGALVIGAATSIWSLRDVTDVDLTQATFVPVGAHQTGSTAVHEVGIAEGQIWFVNTAFSSLCTTDALANFVVRWRPPFIEDDGPVDCCHLNGMAMGRHGPELVTMLARSGLRSGWRSRVPDSGVLMDLTGSCLAEGLSLPHSPQIRPDGTWVLEAGAGRLTLVSELGRTTPVIELPGVLRGMDFSCGHAFIGLSTVRSTSESTLIQTLESRGLAAMRSSRVHCVDFRQPTPSEYVEIPLFDEVSSVCVVPKPRIRVLEPSPIHGSTTYVYRIGADVSPR